jgi:hypothetical protein
MVVLKKPILSGQVLFEDCLEVGKWFWKLKIRGFGGCFGLAES